MSFHEVRLDTDIGESAVVTLRYNTQVITARSGFEQRRAIWSRPLRDIAIETRLLQFSQYTSLIEFYHARQGNLYGFRFKDWLDFKSCAYHDAITNQDQTLGTGDGTTKAFQLKKAYGTSN